MNHFEYRNGEMYAEDVALKRIAQEVGTPAYVYSLATLTRHYSVFDQAFAKVPHIVCFSVKANSNLALLRCLRQTGQRFRYRLGRRAVPRPESRRRSQAHRFFRRRQKEGRSRVCAQLGHLDVQRRVRRGVDRFERDRRRYRQKSADQFARQSRRRSADPSLYFHRHEKGQVRRRYQALHRSLQEGGDRLRTSKSSASTAISARN